MMVGYGWATPGVKHFIRWFASGSDRRESLPLRYLAAVGEASEVPRRSPGRGPPYWKSQMLRRQVLGDEQDCGSRGDGADEVA